jgi:hypothetical protein
MVYVFSKCISYRLLPPLPSEGDEPINSRPSIGNPVPTSRTTFHVFSIVAMYLRIHRSDLISPEAFHPALNRVRYVVTNPFAVATTYHHIVCACAFCFLESAKTI